MPHLIILAPRLTFPTACPRKNGHVGLSSLIGSHRTSAVAIVLTVIWFVSFYNFFSCKLSKSIKTRIFSNLPAVIIWRYTTSVRRNVVYDLGLWSKRRKSVPDESAKCSPDSALFYSTIKTIPQECLKFFFTTNEKLTTTFFFYENLNILFICKYKIDHKHSNKSVINISGKVFSAKKVHVLLLIFSLPYIGIESLCREISTSVQVVQPLKWDRWVLYC